MSFVFSARDMRDIVLGSLVETQLKHSLIPLGAAFLTGYRPSLVRVKLARSGPTFFDDRVSFKTISGPLFC
jgi:hypothetical protein